MKKREIEKAIDMLRQRVRMLECNHKHTITRNSTLGGFDKKCIYCGKTFELTVTETVQFLALELKKLCEENKIKMEDIEV